MSADPGATAKPKAEVGTQANAEADAEAGARASSEANPDGGAHREPSGKAGTALPAPEPDPQAGVLRDPMPEQVKADLAIALNAAGWASQEPVCRLALRPELWFATAGPSRCTHRARRHAARACGVSAKRLNRALTVARSYHRRARAERRRARDLEVEIVTFWDEGYPESLRGLELPPPVLYVRGSIEAASRLSVSIVGSRRADAYGLDVAERFAAELAAVGLNVVSGLALGIDSAAHRGALARRTSFEDSDDPLPAGAAGRDRSGTTVAVLGCGIDVDYPKSNRALARRIAEHGTLISEFAPGTPPLARNFPVRNRLIAALGLGTLVVRATARSGSLITAGLALGLGRLVWAVPGNVFDPRSAGPNTLIRDGAHPIQSPSDLVETLPVAVREALELDRPRRAQPEREDLRRLAGMFEPGRTLTQHDLVRASGLPIDRLLGLLTELELGGWIRRFAGPSWAQAPVLPGGTGETESTER